MSDSKDAKSNRIHPITWLGDPESWIEDQLIYRFRHEEPASVFLELRNVYQSRRNREKDLEQCKVKPQPGKFPDIEKIDY